MSLKLCTWNSQGDPTTDRRKMELLNSLWNTCDVVLLQECGALKKIEDVHPVKCSKTPQVGAYNDRCTTAILSKMDFSCDPDRSPSGTGRSLIVARFKSFPFAVMTLHAESGTGADVWSLIRDKQSFILGGDLNCTPDDLRGKHPCDFNDSNGRFVISAPSSATHEHGSELDYFIHTKDIACKNTYTWDDNGGSDHFPVLTEAYRA